MAGTLNINTTLHSCVSLPDAQGYLVRLDQTRGAVAKHQSSDELGTRTGWNNPKISLSTNLYKKSGSYPE